MIANKQITDSDMIVLQSVESYLKSLGTPINQHPQERLIVTQKARDFLYSDIVQRAPRIAAYLLSTDLETDTVGQGLYFAMSRHVMDPIFVNILMQFLARANNADENGVVGALLTKIMSKHIESKTKQTETKSKKNDKEELQQMDMSDVAHIQKAIDQLLGSLADLVCAKCGNVTHVEATAIAACIAMNNKDSITEIVASDLPITADVFNILSNPGSIIKGALLLEKSEVTKLTKNQQAFLDSLSRWVFKKLNDISMQQCYQFLVATYGTMKPDVSKYFIYLKDCGNAYPQLREVAKQLID